MHSNPASILPAFTPCPTRKRSRFLNLIQIGAILLVVGAHTGVRGVQLVHVAVELFFVIAGLNMAKYIDRYETLASFVWSRARRLMPEIFVVWFVALLGLLAVLRGSGVEAFLITIPIFLGNFAEPYLRPVPGVNWVFLAALWFASALLQLQAIVFLLRRAFTRYRPLLLLSVTVSAGLVFRALVASLQGGITRDVGYTVSDGIYRMAITHACSFVFGFMLGRGLLATLGRWFPTIAIVAAGVGATNYVFARSHIAISSCGFPPEMPLNFQYLWGYPLVALLLASFCAPDNVIAAAVERVKVKPSIDRFVDLLARLTYGVYIFHGLILAGLEYELWSHRIASTASIRIVLVVIVTCSAFASAYLFQRGWRWLRCRICDGYPALVLSRHGQLPPRCIACGHLA